MTYQIIQAESYWDCIDSLRRDDAYKGHLVDALSELRRQPFRNPQLSTHEIGLARNGRKLFSSDVGGRSSNRRIVWQLFNRTIVVLLYGAHKIQDRAKRMQVAFDQDRQLVQVYELAPDSDIERPYQEQRTLAGKLFMAWTNTELFDLGFPGPTVEHLRRLNTVDELFDLEQYLGSQSLESAFNLITADESSRSSEQPTGPEAPGVIHVTGATDAAPVEETPATATPPVVTAEDLELERLLNDERTGAWFTRVEPEFLAEVIGRPIEDWMIFLHPDQRSAATRPLTRVPPGCAVPPARARPSLACTARPTSLPASRAILAERSDQLLADPEPVPPVLFTTYIRTLPPVFEGLYLAHARHPGR